MEIRISNNKLGTRIIIEDSKEMIFFLITRTDLDKANNNNNNFNYQCKDLIIIEGNEKKIIIFLFFYQFHYNLYIFYTVLLY